MEEKAPNLQLQEPVSPESLLPATDFTLWGIGLVVLLLLILGIWWLTKRRKVAAVDPTAQRRAAYQAAKQAFESLNAPNAREAAVRCSLILRRFLADAVADPSLFETHEEFIARQDALGKLKPAAREAAATGFSHLAKLKYAPEIPTDEPARVIAGSRELLETLNGGFEP